MTEPKKKTLSFAEWLQANAPDKDADLRKFVKEWAGKPDSVAILDKYFHEVLGDKWIAYKTLRRITR